MPNNKKRSHSRAVQLRKGNNKKIEKIKITLKEAHDEAHTLNWTVPFGIPKSKNYLQELQRRFREIVEANSGYIRCGLHKFSTNDWSEWNKHMENDAHEMNGSIMCVHCKKPIPFEHLPIFPGMARRFQCKKCKRYTRTIINFPWNSPPTLDIIN